MREEARVPSKWGRLAGLSTAGSRVTGEVRGQQSGSRKGGEPPGWGPQSPR
jgi:hypothetical protein